MLSKLKTIILSRFKNNKEEIWIKKRREICLECKHNSLIGGTPNMYKFFLATLSSFYSWLVGKSKEDSLGNCTACDSCSIYYKTLELDETCPKHKWKK